MRTPVAVENARRFAGDLMDLLVDAGPLTASEACQKLGWSRGRFDGALSVARNDLCPALGMAIPSPAPVTGWKYEVTTEWGPVEVGASYSLGLVESRLRSLHRDVKIVLPHLEVGTQDWRRANFLNKHLGHLLSTLSEIDNG